MSNDSNITPTSTSTSTDAAPSDPSNQVWNVPNQLSALRLLMSFLVFFLIPTQLFLAALIFFIIAASTDWIDGWYARKYNQVTKLGRILDPFCDKIIICGTFILLAVEMKEFPWHVKIAGWMAVVVVGRELLVTALRGFIEQHGGDFSASMSGKLKMVFQCVTVGAALVVLIYFKKSEGVPMQDVPPWVSSVLIGALWLAVGSTIYSGIGYVFAAAKIIKSQTV